MGHDDHVAPASGLLDRRADQSPERLPVAHAGGRRCHRGDAQHVPVAPATGSEALQEAVHECHAPLDVGQLIHRDALGRRRLLDDLLVDEHVAEGVGDQLADLGSAGTENPRDADHPPRHRRTVRRGALCRQRIGLSRRRPRRTPANVTQGTLAGMILESTHVATAIDRPAQEVYAFVSDPLNLPAWAAGLAQQRVAQVGGEWIAESPMGRVKVAFARDPTSSESPTTT